VPVVIAGLASAALLGAVATGWDAAHTGRTGLATAAAVAMMGAAGWWDDRHGDEETRGFAGHLTSGRLTGGVVKVAAGAAAGVAAGLIVYRDRLGMVALTALAVPLAANLFNLLDRAPGRTGKAAVLVAAPLFAFGNPVWAVAAAGTFGGLLAVLPADLGERGMLGDAGANPVGAVIGLGLAVSLEGPALAAAVVVLLLLNLASERWSFSEVIDCTPALRTLDRLGRK
jgi:hypothetical protein